MRTKLGSDDATHRQLSGKFHRALAGETRKLLKALAAGNCRRALVHYADGIDAAARAQVHDFSSLPRYTARRETAREQKLYDHWSSARGEFVGRCKVVPE